MKKLFLFILLLGCARINAQNTDAWKRYSFGNICSISIPSSLELRDPTSLTGNFMDKGVQMYTIKLGGDTPEKRIVFQPFGLNSSDPKVVHSASEKYARVIVELSSSDGISQSDVDELSASDISELNTIFYESYLSDMKLMYKSPDLFQWFPIKRKMYSGRNALVLHFKRPGLQGTVDVTEYRFFLQGQQMRIIVSYRDSERTTWATDLESIISTIKFK